MNLNTYIWKGLKRVPSFFLFVLIISHLNTSFAFVSKELKTVSKSPEWKSLLRYETPLLKPWRHDSIIKDKDFFFAPNGNSDSLSELKATLAAFQKPVGKNINNHAICKFPARYKWLKKQLLVENQDNILKQCKLYQKWQSGGKITSVSLVFATGYFGNPASFFGHPFLKFNQEGKKTALTDTSINYGALTPSDENPVIYVLKGLAGGYDASFTRHDFFSHNHNYTQNEMRDLWEYRLNLKPEEVQQVIDRTWELLGKKHPYYFFSDNCASRMAQLLEDIFKKSLLFKNKLYVIPIDVYDNLASGTRHDGSPMVKEINYIPSKHSKLAKIYHLLSSPEKRWVKKIIKNNDLIKNKKFIKIPQKQKARVLETLIHYYSFLKVKHGDSEKVEKARLSLIRERFTIPQKSSFSNLSFNKKYGPHNSVNSFGIGLSHGYGKRLKDFQELTFRTALYDELNPSPARPANTGLEILRTKLRIKDSKVSLRGLELFRISTLNTSSIDLPQTGNMPWKMRLGLRSQSQLCENCLVTFAEGGAGMATKLRGISSAYILAKGGFQESRANQGTIYALPEIGTYIEISKQWKILLSYEYEKFINGASQSHDIWTIDSRFGSSKNWDFRLSFKKRDDEQLLATFRLYL